MNYIVITTVFLLVVLMSFTSETTASEQQETAIFGGGCFWCMEPPFEQLDGVIDVVAGYTGGSEEDASYERVSAGATDHYEAVRVRYRPKELSYEILVETFWHQIDPTDDGGQFADRGAQYRSAIFYTTEEQKRIAEQSKADLDSSGLFDRPVVTAILPAEAFYEAEPYHQDYYLKNVIHYNRYKAGSGREAFIETVWKKDEQLREPFKKPDLDELKKKLTPLQYLVTQKNGTEPPFNNEYWDNKKAGIYVDIVSGEVLFSSLDKYESGTGWPSFTKPLEADNIVERSDSSFFTVRTEIRSKHADSHLGHVFTDGPPPTNLRYCMNSAAMRFIPIERLDAEGYGAYSSLFR